MSLVNKICKIFKKNTRSAASENETKVRAHDYVGKFVTKNGTDIGESIAVEESRLIVKNADSFMSIPLEKIVTISDRIVVGDFNQEESLKLGKEWFEKKDTLKFDEKGMLIINASNSQ